MNIHIMCLIISTVPFFYLLVTHLLIAKKKHLQILLPINIIDSIVLNIDMYWIQFIIFNIFTLDFIKKKTNNIFPDLFIFEFTITDKIV